jgi:ABC-type antimicrobial peptide transport system permease subunit
MGAIQKQVKLPITVAFGVAVQGIRIRLGRSLVTLLGVALGIAFLMAILTGQMVRRGVGAETALRAEVRRMQNFLAAETGPLKDRTLGVVACGPLDARETRFLAALAKTGLARVQWAGGQSLPSEHPLAPLCRAVERPEAARDAAAVLLVGDGVRPRADWAAELAAARQDVLAATRKAHTVDAVPGVSAVLLERELKPEEVAQAALEARRARFRTSWIIIISLLVTVIGISNAMLMSVTERFREIGTMKCLGALSQFIREIFFIESSLVGLTGSVIGSLFGFVFAAAAFMLTYGGGLVLTTLSPGRLLLYFVASVAAGVVLSIVAAIYPASLASRMVPATALRSTV